MMRILTVASTLLLAVPTFAQAETPALPTRPAAKLVPAGAPQQQDQETLRKLRTEKLGKAVFQNAAWTTDYDAAKQRAAAEGKLVLVYFTRSYAG